MKNEIEQEILCKLLTFGVNFLTVVDLYIENDILKLTNSDGTKDYYLDRWRKYTSTAYHLMITLQERQNYTVRKNMYHSKRIFTNTTAAATK